jgi:uncharacterized coiled-coil protein SlyX
MLDTPQHQVLQIKYQETLLQKLQTEDQLKKKNKINSKLTAQITSLKNTVAETKGTVERQQRQIDALIAIIAEKDKHQYEQLNKLLLQKL